MPERRLKTTLHGLPLDLIARNHIIGLCLFAGPPRGVRVNPLCAPLGCKKTGSTVLVCLWTDMVSTKHGLSHPQITWRLADVIPNNVTVACYIRDEVKKQGRRWLRRIVRGKKSVCGG